MRELPLADLFAQEKVAREIREAKDIEKIRSAALELLGLYYNQKKATNWVMESQLGAPATIIVNEPVQSVPVKELAPRPVMPDHDVL